MKTFQYTGIIFRKIKYSETSLIVDIFTKEKGIRTFIFSGVRKAKAKVSAAMIDHMNIVNIIAYDKESSKVTVKTGDQYLGGGFKFGEKISKKDGKTMRIEVETEKLPTVISMGFRSLVVLMYC